jgi:hypothetical protein
MLQGEMTNKRNAGIRLSRIYRRYSGKSEGGECAIRTHHLSVIAYGPLIAAVCAEVFTHE